MPQLDISTYGSQLFWLVVTFVPLYFFVVRAAIPRIGEVLEARQGKIDDDLEIAGERKTEAEKVLADYEKLQAQSRADAQAVIRQAQEEMKAEASAQGAVLSRKLAQQLTEAEQRIATAQNAALSNLDDTVAEAVSAATAKLIGVRPDDASVRAAISTSGGGES